MRTSNEDLIEFAKDQCEIFPEDSYMGKYLRETIKILEDRMLAESSEDVMWKSVALLNELRTKYYFDEKEEYYKALSLAIQSIRKQMLDKLDVEFFTDLKNELLDKIKQAREEIDTDVRTTVKHFTNTDTVIDYVLDSIDELIESEENRNERKRVFNSISNFARANVVKIDFDFDFLGNLTITMTRKNHTISRTISRAISNSELNWIEDCENTIFYYLNAMLAELIESEEE